jgi:type I restriction enzyme S subunit
MKRLKHVATINNGLDYKKIESEKGYPVFGSGGRFATASKYLCNQEAVLLGRKGTIDKPIYINEKFWTVDTMFYAVCKNAVSTKFIFYICTTIPFKYYSTSTALPSMTQTDLLNLILFIPPLPEQTAIANFLDEKCNKIDRAVAQKEKLVALLKERKQIVIQNAVTKGLNPNAKMKDSGVEWIGEIPEGWEVAKCKFLFYEVDEKSLEGKEELLSVSHMTGVTPRSEKNVNMFLAENYVGSKLCQKGDLIYNIMWSWMGALGISYQEGIVSPSYGVYRQKINEYFNPVYLEELLKSNKYIEHYNKVSTGLHSSRLRFYSHMFFNMKIGFPNKNEQNRIVNYIETQSQKINKAITLQQNQIEKLKEYKSILINNAVTGKIKVC